MAAGVIRFQDEATLKEKARRDMESLKAGSSSAPATADRVRRSLTVLRGVTSEVRGKLQSI